MVQRSPPRRRAPRWSRTGPALLVALAYLGPTGAAAQAPPGPGADGSLPPWLLGIFALVAVLVAAAVGIRGRPPQGARRWPQAPDAPRSSGGHVLLTPLAGPSSASVHLRATEGRLRGNRYEVGSEELRIGRDPSLCHIVLSDPSVSREHALIRSRDGRLTLRNLSGTNPTFLNGRPVEEAALSPGDTVRISSSVFQVASPGARADPDS